MKVPAQFCEWHLSTDRDTVVDNMEIRLAKIDHLLSGLILHPGVGDIPLRRNSPVEDLRPRGDFVNLECDVFGEAGECSSKAVSRNAAADGIELGEQAMHLHPALAPVLCAQDLGERTPPEVRSSPSLGPDCACLCRVRG